MKQRLKRAVASVSGLTIAAVGMVPMLSAPAGAAGDETVTKVAYDANGNAVSTVQGGQVIDNVVTYTNPGGGAADVTFDDTIQPGQTYVPGSFKVPTGFNITKNGPTELQAKGRVAAPATGSAEVVQEPKSEIALGGSTGGDGYIPIPYGDYVYAVFHHTTSYGGYAAKDFQCIDGTTGGLCPGFPAAGIALDSTQSTIAGTTATNLDDLQTPNSPQTYTDPQGRLFIPVEKVGGTFGVLCMQLGTTPCAWTYADAGTGSSGPMYEIGGTLYLTSLRTAQVARVSLATGAVLGTSVDPDPTINFISANYPYPTGTGQLVGSRIYFITNYALGQTTTLFGGTEGDRQVSYGSRMYCYDTATQANCAGWSPIEIPGSDSQLLFNGNSATSAVFENHDVPGSVCTWRGTFALPVTGALYCYDGSGAVVAAPTNLQSALASQIGGFSGIGLEEWYQASTNRTYFIVTGAANGSDLDTATACFDWATNAKCAGFTAPHPFTFAMDYATIEDDNNPGCGWSLGDEAKLYSYDMATGATPCLRIRANTTVDTRTGYYCDGKTGHVQAWNNVTFSPAPDAADWISLEAIVRNADTNAVLKTIDILTGAPGGVASIADIDIVANPALSVEFVGAARNTDPWKTQYPQASVTFTGDAPQFCYKTTIVDDCKVTSTFNEAAITTLDLSGGAPSIKKARIDLKVNLGPQCAGDVTVSKVDGQGNPLAGAEFSINTNPAQTCVTTLPTGTCGWVDIPLGDYVVTETKAPNGYNLSNPASKNVTVAAGQTAPVFANFTNLPKPASIDIVKTAAPLTIHAGDNVTYTFVVTNTGQQDLSNVRLDDNPDNACDATLPNGNTAFTTGNNDGVLNVGEVWTVTCTIPVASPDPHTNIATVTGTPTAGPDVTDNDDASVDIVKSQIHIEKSASPTKIHSGDDVTYTFIVTNVGDPLSDVKVTDSDAGCTPTYVSGDTDTDSKLDSTESWTYTCKIPVTSAMINVEPSGHRNVATATGKDPLGTPSTDDDDALVAIVDSAIMVEKTVAPGVIHAGDNVTYTFKVSLGGDPKTVQRLNNVVLTDSDAACANPLYQSGDANDDKWLDPGETWTYTCTIPVTEAMINDVPNQLHKNTATVKGTDELGKEYSDEDDASVKLIKSQIKIVKSADPVLIHSGDNVTYTFEVTVDGDELHDVVVTDDDAGCVPALQASTQTADNTLSEGETWVYKCTIPVTQEMVDTAPNAHTNVATATGKDELDKPTTATDDAIVAVINPGIKVVKSVDAAGPVIAGTTVTYTYKVTNTGDTPLKDVSITDDKCSAILPAVGAIAPVNGDANGDKKLDVSETWTFTCSQLLNTTTKNVVVVTGKDQLDKEVTSTDDETVTVVRPDLEVTKTDGRVAINRGDALTYTIVVKNVGDGASKRTQLIDTMPQGFVFGSVSGTGPNGAIAATALNGIITSAEFELAPGQQATFTVTGTVDATAPQGDFVNRVSVDNPGGPVDPTPENNRATDVDVLPEVPQGTSVTTTSGPGAPSTTVGGVTAVPGGNLPKTGGPVSMLLIALGLGLTLFGSGLLRLKPRRTA